MDGTFECCINFSFVDFLRLVNNGLKIGEIISVQECCNTVCG